MDAEGVSTYLTALARDPRIRSHPAWQSFFAIGVEELESSRIERRTERIPGGNASRTRVASLSASAASSFAEAIPAHTISDPLPVNDEAEVLEIRSSLDSFGGDRSVSKGTTRQVNKTQARGRRNEVSINSFDILRVLGKGCAGKVLLVRRKSVGRVYAMKAIQKTHVGALPITASHLVEDIVN